MPKIYTTLDGDMVDAICWRHYGSEKNTFLVFEANPGLVELSYKLPPGISIILPDIEDKPEQYTNALWD